MRFAFNSLFAVMGSRSRMFEAQYETNFCAGSGSCDRSSDLNISDEEIANQVQVISVPWNGSWTELIRGLNLPD
jgi:hypothetical protein